MRDVSFWHIITWLCPIARLPLNRGELPSEVSQVTFKSVCICCNNYPLPDVVEQNDKAAALHLLCRLLRMDLDLPFRPLSCDGGVCSGLLCSSLLCSSNPLENSSFARLWPLL